jgi:hypothetical protein
MRVRSVGGGILVFQLSFWQFVSTKDDELVAVVMV